MTLQDAKIVHLQQTALMAERNATPKPAAADEATPETPTGDSGPVRPTEHGGPRGPEPTRYGDWERKGRCVDF